MKKLLIAVCFIFFTAVLSYANLTVAPSRIDILIEKDDVFTSSYTLTNTYDKDVYVDIAVEDWNSYKGNGTLDANSWLKILHTAPIRIQPGETKVIPYEIKTTNSMLGSVSAMVSFSHRPPGNESIIVKISCSVYLTIRGTDKIDFSIDKIDVLQQGTYAIAYVSVNNAGNVHVRPSGTLNIYKGKKVVASAPIPEGFPTYAGSVAGYKSNTVLIENLKPGKYTLEAVINALDKTVTKKTEIRIKKDGSLIQ